MGTQIVFETHSISEDNERGVASDWHQSRLSAAGRLSAKELGKRRQNDRIQAVFTSDLRRAIETAEIAFSHIESQTRIIRRSYDNLVLDNRNHYLPCEKLPTEAEVRAILQQHQDIVQAIEQVNPGHVGLDVDSSACPGEADLVIWYASHQNRLAIEAIIGRDTFFGVPYRLQNR